ncbi:hypothetical protein NQZ68_023220 [Dissostichus eleginoides]|nr:hypothetical protein NQZ68_023220 [Dissostichus eleginoides]
MSNLGLGMDELQLARYVFSRFHPQPALGGPDQRERRAGEGGRGSGGPWEIVPVSLLWQTLRTLGGIHLPPPHPQRETLPVQSVPALLQRPLHHDLPPEDVRRRTHVYRCTLVLFLSTLKMVASHMELHKDHLPLDFNIE